MDIKNKSQFIEFFSKGIKSQNNLKIGVEHERFLFEGENKKRISYETLKKLFENLKVNGWEPLYEKENIIGMQRDNQQITTEPGLQCELSGAPLENIHQVCSESSKFLKEIILGNLESKCGYTVIDNVQFVLSISLISQITYD